MHDREGVKGCQADAGPPGLKAVSKYAPGVLSAHVAGGTMKVKKKILGRYVVADPAVCHGQPTFRGTRILVSDVLEQVATGMAWEAITEEWRGTVTKEAIAESVRLARAALLGSTPQASAS